METRGKAKYDGVLNIPQRQVGTYSIVHDLKRAGETVPLNTMRNNYFGQGGAQEIGYPYATRWHRLEYERGTWMTDLPVEQRQCDELIRGVFAGTVLVGGLGIGYAATVLAKRSGVRSVYVVEKSAEVIALVEDAMRRNLERPEADKIVVVHEDLFEFLKRQEIPNGRMFTHAFYDIWQLDSEHVFFDTVVPLLRLSNGVVRHRPICWNEDVMRGQLLFSLSSAMRPAPPGMEEGWPTREYMATPLPEDDPGAIWRNWRAPFFQWLIAANPSDKRAQEMAATYVRNYGMPAAEKSWQNILDAAVQRKAVTT